MCLNTEAAVLRPVIHTNVEDCEPFSFSYYYEGYGPT